MREGFVGKGILNPLKDLEQASYSESNNMITLTFSNGNSMYLNTKAGRAKQALEGLLKDVQHIATQSTYDVASAPGYNDVTGPKLFQLDGEVFVVDYTQTTGNASLVYGSGAFLFSFSDMGCYESTVPLALQVISDITATFEYNAGGDPISLEGISTANISQNDAAIVLNYASSVSELSTAPSSGDTITIPEFVVIDPVTGESFVVATKTYTFP